MVGVECVVCMGEELKQIYVQCDFEATETEKRLVLLPQCFCFDAPTPMFTLTGQDHRKNNK